VANKAKPFGIVAIAVWAAFSGVLLLPMSLLSLIAGQADGAKGLLFTGAGILFSALGVGAFTCMYGLWSLQDWGRKFTLWYSWLSIPLGITSIFPIWPGQQVTTGNTVLQLVGIVISAIIIGYLSRPRVQAFFVANAG
jgi:hypothetical protein